eukprot:2715124-Alexandrium_andersonii.AAC.1
MLPDTAIRCHCSPSIFHPAPKEQCAPLRPAQLPTQAGPTRTPSHFPTDQVNRWPGHPLVSAPVSYTHLTLPTICSV